MPRQTRKTAPKKTLKANTIAEGDCIAQMNAWAEASPGTADLIFADPPYNIGFEYDGHYVDQRPDDEYLQWTYDWIDAATRLLKPTGSFYILIGDEYAAEVRLHLKRLQASGGLLFRNWIVWHYTFGQRCKIKFNRSHAHLFYCVGSAALVKARKPRGGGELKGPAYKPKNKLATDPPFTFHYDEVALPSARMTTYNDPRQNPKGKLPDDTWVLKFPAMENWHVRPQDAAEEGAFDTGWDTWYQSRLAGTFKEREQWHPCQLPEALLERIIRCSSNEGDLVFDPFAGSGTTLAVAHRLQRDWLGCELSPEYRKKALERITADPAQRAAKPVVTKNGKRAGAANRKR